MGTLHEVSNAGIVDFKKKGTTGLILEQGTSDPGDASVEGQIFYRTDTDELKISDGAVFNTLSVSIGGGWQDNGVTITLVTNTDQIQIGDGSAATPALGFENDPNTGIYSVGADNIGITVGGTLRLDIDTTSVTSTLPFYAPDGILALPGYVFAADTNTGIYRVSADRFALVAGGVRSIDMASTITIMRNQVRFSDGTVSLPAISWENDVDSGFYRVSANSIGVAIGGVQKMIFDGNGNFRISDGTAALPGLAFINDGDTGIYWRATNSLAISTGTSQAFYFGPTANVSQFNLLSGTATEDLGDASNYWAHLYVGSGTAALPSLSFGTDVDSGFYRVSANSIGVAIGGVQKMIFDGSGNLRVSDGTVSLPGISFINESDSGIYRVGLNRWALVVNGASKIDMADTITLLRNQVRFSDGTAALPSISFESDSDTGFYRSAGNTLNWSTGGVNRGFLWNGGIRTPNSTATAPAFAFVSDSNTGIYSVGADNIGITVGGTLRLDIDTTSVTSTLPFYAPDGLVGSPGYAFSGDTNTGMYRDGTDQLGLITGGVERIRLSNTGINIKRDLSKNGTAGLEAVDIRDGVIGTSKLKTSTGSSSGASGGGTIDITMNDYSFFPSQATWNGRDDIVAWTNGGSDPGNTVGRFGKGGTFNYAIRWRYVTASDRPRIWILMKDGKIVGIWESEDPPNQTEYDEDDDPFESGKPSEERQSIKVPIIERIETKKLLNVLKNGQDEQECRMARKMVHWLNDKPWMTSFKTSTVKYHDEILERIPKHMTNVGNLLYFRSILRKKAPSLAMLDLMDYSKQDKRLILKKDFKDILEKI